MGHMVDRHTITVDVPDEIIDEARRVQDARDDDGRTLEEVVLDITQFDVSV